MLGDDAEMSTSGGAVKKPPATATATFTTADASGAVAMDVDESATEVCHRLLTRACVHPSRTCCNMDNLRT